MGLFSDIYNTVAKFFRPVETENDASKSVATNRLKLVLMQDRTNLTPKILEQMRGEMIDLLSKYLEMDKDMLELNFEQEGDQVALMLSIPVIRAKDEEEIEAAGVNLNEEGDNSEENDEENDSEEDECDDNTEEVSESDSEEGEEVKPKKRRSKKVTPPSEMESSEVNSETLQDEPVTETVEG